MAWHVFAASLLSFAGTAVYDEISPPGDGSRVGGECIVRTKRRSQRRRYIDLLRVLSSSTTREPTDINRGTGFFGWHRCY
jgi:hypothetical protein